MTSTLIAARIIEEVKQIIEAGLQDVPDEQVMEILPKINMAVNVHCVDGILALMKMDDPPTSPENHNSCESNT